MINFSYKGYLDYLKNLKKPSFFKRTSIFLALGLFVFLGFVSTLDYLWQKEASLRAKEKYLEVAKSSLNSSEQTISELLQIFKVAGVKIELTGEPVEGTPSPQGFFTSLDDLQRTLSFIEAGKNNLKFQKKFLIDNPPPKDFTELNNNLLDYINTAENSLAEISKDQNFAKDLLTALGPNFFLPTLINDALWEIAESDDIINYYQDIKLKADSALADLARLTVPLKFESFYQTQIAYLEHTTFVSDSIINTLKESESADPETATRKEKAYQLLNTQRSINEELSQKILGEKLKLVDLRENLERLAVVSLKQNSLQGNLNDLSSSLPEKRISVDFSQRILDSTTIFGVFTSSLNNLLK